MVIFHHGDAAEGKGEERERTLPLLYVARIHPQQKTQGGQGYSTDKRKKENPI